MDTASEGGIDFFDTADVYPLGGGANTVGRTEEIVGNWLVGKRHEVIVATKCVGRTGRRAWDQGMSRKHILDGIDRSLLERQHQSSDFHVRLYDTARAAAVSDLGGAFLAGAAGSLSGTDLAAAELSGKGTSKREGNAGVNSKGSRTSVS